MDYSVTTQWTQWPYSPCWFERYSERIGRSLKSEAGHQHNEMRRKTAKALQLLRALGAVAQLLKLRSDNKNWDKERLQVLVRFDSMLIPNLKSFNEDLQSLETGFSLPLLVFLGHETLSCFQPCQGTSRYRTWCAIRAKSLNWSFWTTSFNM